jgi:hypothetical protein
MVENLSPIHPYTPEPMLKPLLHTTPPLASRREDKVARRQTENNGARSSKNQTDELLPDKQRMMKSWMGGGEMV